MQEANIVQPTRLGLLTQNRRGVQAPCRTDQGRSLLPTASVVIILLLLSCASTPPPETAPTPKPPAKSQIVRNAKSQLRELFNQLHGTRVDLNRYTGHQNTLRGAIKHRAKNPNFGFVVTHEFVGLPPMSTPYEWEMGIKIFEAWKAETLAFMKRLGAMGGRLKTALDDHLRDRESVEKMTALSNAIEEADALNLEGKRKFPKHRHP